MEMCNENFISLLVLYVLYVVRYIPGGKILAVMPFMYVQ